MSEVDQAALSEAARKLFAAPGAWLQSAPSLEDIPPADVPTLREMGAAAVFGPGTVIAEAAHDLVAALSAALHGPAGE